MTAVSSEEEAIRAAIAPHRSQPGPLLVILHAVQDALGHVPARAIPMIADALNLSRAEVQGVVSFYHHFRTVPGGQLTVRLCRAEACQAMRGEQLADHVVKRLGIRFGETSADGRVTLESVYCLGLCSMSPAAMIAGQVHGRLSPGRFDELLSEVTRQ